MLLGQLTDEVGRPSVAEPMRTPSISTSVCWPRCRGSDAGTLARPAVARQLDAALAAQQVSANRRWWRGWSRSMTTTSATMRRARSARAAPPARWTASRPACAQTDDRTARAQRHKPAAARCGAMNRKMTRRTFHCRTPRAARFKARPGRERRLRHVRMRQAQCTCLRRPPRRQLPVHQAGIRARECRCPCGHRSARRLPRWCHPVAAVSNAPRRPLWSAPEWPGVRLPAHRLPV